MNMPEDPEPHLRLPWGLLALMILPTLATLAGLTLYALAVIGD